jgi:hypothetical protein
MSINTAGTRLPGSQQRRRGAEVASGVAALVGTILIVVGLPLALLSAFGTPWPDSSPSVEWLTRPVTPESVLGLLAVVVWLAWAHFVICLLVEAIAGRGHRGAAAPHVPGGGLGTQTLARRLVATILLLVGTAGVTVGPAMAASAPVTASSSSSVASVTADRLQPAVQHTAHDAVHAGGAHSGRPAADDLERATRSDVAQGVTTFYDVKPPHGRNYDTLWDVAERYLGSGLRYKEIWELNKDVVQADGRVLRNADLIRPGWVMKMPNDAKGPGLKVVDHAAALVGSSTPTSPTQNSASQTSTHLAAPADEAARAGESSPFLDPGLAPLFGVAGGIALAGVALGLRRRRASASFGQLWASRLRLTGPGPDGGPEGGPGRGGAVQAGVALGAEADGSVVRWLDRGLRGLSAGPVPAPSAVSLSGAGVAVAFEGEVGSPPAGWIATGSKVWTLDRDVELSGHGPAPLPGLVALGRRDDGSLAFVDLESVPGVVCIGGDGVTARGVAMSLALDTATHPWADERVVTLVNFASADLGALAPDRLRHTDDLGRVLESLENLATYQRGACRAAGLESARAARCGAPGAITWAYHLVVCSGVPSPEDLSRLAALAADPQVALGVVVVGETPEASMRLTVRDDARLVSPLHGIDVTPQVLDAKAVESLRELCEELPDAHRVSLDQVVETLESEQHASVVDSAVVRVGILGPITVEAPGPLEAERRNFLTELACLLALHPEGLHVNRITAAMWPRGVDDAVRDATLAQLGAWFGTTPDGAPVLREEAGVWSVVPGALSLDWTQLRAALNQVPEEGRARDTHLRLALDLVRGTPFEDAPLGRYSWLVGTTMTDDVALVVGLTAQALAEHAADRGDVEAAASALERGLALLPANEDLWRSRLLLAKRFGARAEVERVASHMYDVIEEHGSAVGAAPQTDALVAELLPGWSRRAA